MALEVAAAEREETLPCFPQGKLSCVNALLLSVKMMLGSNALAKQFQTWILVYYFYLFFLRGEQAREETKFKFYRFVFVNGFLDDFSLFRRGLNVCCAFGKGSSCLF